MIMVVVSDHHLFFSISAGLLLGTLVPLSLLLLVIVRCVRQNGSQKQLPPGTMGWPVVGETLAFLRPHGSNSQGEFLQEHRKRFGPVFKSHLFGCKTIVSCDPELNAFVLQNEERLFQASYPKAMQGILGTFSLLLVSGELHKKMRSLVICFVGVLKSKPEFLCFVDKLAELMMSSWIGRDQICFHKEVKQFTLNLVLKHLLSLEPGEAVGMEILEDFLTYMKGFISLPLYIPGTAYTNAVKARARLSWTVKRIIKEREVKNKVISGINNMIGGGGGGDFLDEIMLKRTLSPEQVVSLVLDIMLGGYETTATLISLATYFLANSPHALHKLKEEHHAIRTSKMNGEPLSWGDYQKMEFTHKVVQETLRCGNIVKFLHRKALQDIEFKEYAIPKGWKVFPVLAAAHLDTCLHEDPMNFNPWRWDHNQEIIGIMSSRKVMAFGGGPRLCPGADLAKVEAAFFLHHFVLNYRWKTKTDEIPLAYPFVEFKRSLVLEIAPAAAAAATPNDACLAPAPAPAPAPTIHVPPKT